MKEHNRLWLSKTQEMWAGEWSLESKFPCQMILPHPVTGVQAAIVKSASYSHSKLILIII